MRCVVAIVAVWLVSVAASWAQNCVISGGTNYGSITQNCSFVPPPLSLQMDHFENQKSADGSFDHRILVRFNAAVNMILTACGEGVVDLDAFPWPAGMMVGPTTSKHDNCIQKNFPNISPGSFVFSVKTNVENAPFTLQPVLQ
jgi:hypothetical protein